MLPTLETLWYGQHGLRFFLIPFSLVYQAAMALRRVYLRAFIQQRIEIPIIVVGNITVGGVGKTPLVIALATAMIARGIRVGIVSRGYGGSRRDGPYHVTNVSQASEVGDEPLLMAQRTQCPVVIARKRIEAVDYLIKHHACQIIISDDGLQHEAMGRAIEIAVIDGMRGFGNGWCLPAGPLREPVTRLKSCDWVVVNEGSREGAYPMTLQPKDFISLLNGSRLRCIDIQTPVAAVAGIGNPERFFKMLEAMGLTIERHAFPDHHVFTASDFTFKQPLVLMTEKDAVKCRAFAQSQWYYVPVDAQLNADFWQVFWSHNQLKKVLT